MGPEPPKIAERIAATRPMMVIGSTIVDILKCTLGKSLEFQVEIQSEFDGAMGIYVVDLFILKPI